MSFFSKIKEALFEEEEPTTKSFKDEIEKELKQEEKPVFDKPLEEVEKTVEIKKEELNKFETLKPAEFDIFEDNSFIARSNPAPVREEIKRREYKPSAFSSLTIDEINTKTRKEPFKATPIISPVHGVIEENPLAKYDFNKPKVEKTEVLNENEKVYVTPMGVKTYKVTNSKVIEKEKEEDKVIDLKADKVPTVDNVTIKDAKSYFDDLGLAYNVNYKDESTSKKPEAKHVLKEEVKEEPTPKKEEPKEEKIEAPVIEVPDVNKKTEEKKEDDDLFSMIELMYKKD